VGGDGWSTCARRQLQFDRRWRRLEHAGATEPLFRGTSPTAASGNSAIPTTSTPRRTGEEPGGEPTIWVSKDFVLYSLKISIRPGARPGGNGWAWWAPMSPSAGRQVLLLPRQQQPRHLWRLLNLAYGPWTSLGAIMQNNYVSGVLTLDAQTFKMPMAARTPISAPGPARTRAALGPLQQRHEELQRSVSSPTRSSAAASVSAKGPSCWRQQQVLFMYSNGSCFDSSYAVRYSTGSSPTGPFTYAKQILARAPTHRGRPTSFLLQEGSDYYIIYHRHDNPHSTGGEFRQEAADRMTFDSSGNINTVTPTHTGIGYSGPSEPNCNLAYARTVTASSSYTDTARSNFNFSPTTRDDNNGTLWKAGDSLMGHWLRWISAVQTVPGS